MSFYEKGPVRIHFEEKGSGFPLLMIAGGGLNSAISNLSAPYSPFNAMGSSSTNTAASAPTFATLMAASPQVPSRSIAPGILIPTTISA